MLHRDVRIALNVLNPCKALFSAIYKELLVSHIALSSTEKYLTDTVITSETLSVFTSQTYENMLASMPDVTADSKRTVVILSVIVGLLSVALLTVAAM